MRGRWWIIGLLLALIVAILSPLASSQPDGLERVAEDQGFGAQAKASWYQVMPDYLLPGVQNKGVATILAGVLGTSLVFGIMFGLGRLLHRRSTLKS